MLGLCLLPEGEVGLVALLPHSVEFAAGVDDIVEVAPGEDAVGVFLVVLLDIEIHAAVALVGEAVVEDFLDKLLLFDNMSGGMWLDAGRQHIEGLHGLVVAVGIILCYLHGLELFEPCFLGYLVIAVVGIVLQVSYVGDVAHIAHLISQVLEVSEHQVEGDSGSGVSQVWVAINGGSTHIHPHVGCMEWLERFFSSAEGVVNDKCLFHLIKGSYGKYGRYGRRPE